MKKLLSLILATLMLLGCVAAFSACADEETLVCGVTIFENMNEKDANGNWTGFESEFAMAVGEILGMKVEFQEIIWEQKYNELNSGAIDCIWNGFTANSNEDDGTARNTLVDFSTYYMQNAQCIVRKGGSDISDWSAMSEKPVAYEAGSAADSLVKGSAPENAIKKPVSTQMNAINEVLMETAAYAVVDVLLAQSICGKGDYASLVINNGIELGVEYYAVGFKKGSTLTAKVNAEFVKLAQNGYVQQLAQKYNLTNSLLLGLE